MSRIITPTRRIWEPTLQTYIVYSWLVCPRHLEMDQRIGEYSATSRYPINIRHKHKAEDFDSKPTCGCLWDYEGHDTLLVITYQQEDGTPDPRCIHLQLSEWPKCSNCNQSLIHSDLAHLPTVEKFCGNCSEETKNA